jgi:ankyrin repeat protein
MLLDAGADVNSVQLGRTALMCASMAGRASTVRYLLTRGADPNAEGDEGGTPLRSVAMLGNPKEPRRRIVESLLAAGANLNVRDQHGMTALMYAAKHGDLEMVELLISLGADPGIRSAIGAAALDLAVSASNRRTAFRASSKDDMRRVIERLTRATSG